MKRSFAIVTSIAALASFAQWMIFHRLASGALADDLPLFVGLVQLAVKKGMVAGAACLWLIAITGALASGLALFLAVRSGEREDARTLALALGAGALSVAYFYFLLPYPIAGAWRGPATPAATLLVLDALAFALWALAMLSLVRFFQLFPEPVSQEDWDLHIAAWTDSNRDVYATGWRKRLYPKRLNDSAYWEGVEQDGNALARLVARGRSARTLARMHRFPQSRAALLALCAVGLGAACAQYAIRVALGAMPGGERAPFALVLLPTLFVWVLGIGAAVIAHSYLRFHRRRGSDEDRRRVAWIDSTVFVAGVFSFGAFQAGFALFVVLVLFALEALPATGLEQLLIVPMLLAAPLFALACTVALVLSVFYRGAIDPRHAARRVTMWGLLGLLVTVVFVVLERAVTVKLSQWLSLPSETGPLAAGALVAATITPMRTRVERMTQSLSARFLPLDVIAVRTQAGCRDRAVRLEWLYGALREKREAGAAARGTPAATRGARGGRARRPRREVHG